MFSSPAPDHAGRLLAPVLLMLLALPALAQEEGDPAADPVPPDDTELSVPTTVVRTDAGEEITIYDTAEIERRRAQLESIIESQDYKDGIRKDDRTIFRPRVPWKPSVVVHDDGIVQLTRSPVRWMAPGDPSNKLNSLWCLPPFTPMCVRIGGQVISKRKLDAHKNKVLAQTHPASESWRQAIVDKATFDRVNNELPAMIEAAWTSGHPLDDDGPTLETPAQRRQALLDFWATRSDTREGQIVAQVVADFLAYEVQSSEHPVTPQELAAANARAAGVRQLVLDLPPDTQDALPSEQAEPSPPAAQQDGAADPG